MRFPFLGLNHYERWKLHCYTGGEKMIVIGQGRKSVPFLEISAAKGYNRRPAAPGASVKALNRDRLRQ
jgi:hypothetical protein